VSCSHKSIGSAAGANAAVAETELDPLTETEGFDLVGVLSSIDETAYIWDLATDRIEWESNAIAVLGVDDISQIQTGAGFDRFIAPEHAHIRMSAFNGGSPKTQVSGTPYRLQYRILPQGQRGIPVWIEDHGRWWPDADGRPQRARGVVRIIHRRV